VTPQIVSSNDKNTEGFENSLSENINVEPVVQENDKAESASGRHVSCGVNGSVSLKSPLKVTFDTGKMSETWMAREGTATSEKPVNRDESLKCVRLIPGLNGTKHELSDHAVDERIDVEPTHERDEPE
jgi:hypothetical protein